MHGTPRVTYDTGSLFECLLGSLDVLVPGFFRRRWDRDIKLKSVVRIGLGGQGEV